jgi:hypothetical protein
MCSSNVTTYEEMIVCDNRYENDLLTADLLQPKKCLFNFSTLVTKYAHKYIINQHI